MKNILIATFSFRLNGKRTAINGMVEPLLNSFLPKTQNLTLIDGSHPGSETVLTIVEQYKNKKLTNHKNSFPSKILSPLLGISNTNATQLFFKFRDLLDVLWIGLQRQNYELFIGLESVYTLGGVILRKLGKVKKVVYYVSDYSSNRYTNKLLNTIYVWLDRFCCYNADYIWDVSPMMMPARIRAGLNTNKCAPSFLVPNALFEKQISYLPVHELEKNSLVYLGTLGIENGPQVAIKAMKDILRKIPNAKLHIIGGNEPTENTLKNLAKKLEIEKSIIFHGFVSEAVEVSRLAQKFMIGLAPYTEVPNSPRWFADATKIRLYMGAGLPVITTKVPPLGKEVALKGAAIIVKDDSEELAETAIKLLQDKKFYLKMRQAAISYAKNNTWENSYNNAIKHVSLFG